MLLTPIFTPSTHTARYTAHGYIDSLSKLLFRALDLR
jgi:hypothetical protein